MHPLVVFQRLVELVHATLSSAGLSGISLELCTYSGSVVPVNLPPHSFCFVGASVIVVRESCSSGSSVADSSRLLPNKSIASTAGNEVFICERNNNFTFRNRENQQMDIRHQQKADDRPDAHEQDQVQKESTQRKTSQRHMEGLSKQRGRPTGQLAHYKGGFSGYFAGASSRTLRMRPRPNHREESHTGAATQPVRNVISSQCLSLKQRGEIPGKTSGCHYTKKNKQ